MPRYYCDYCDTYLTHDSPSVRKQHNAGYKHKANVRSYYQQFEEQQTQSLIDQRIKEHLGQAAQYQQVGATFNHLLSLQTNLQRPRLPVPSPLPFGTSPSPMISPLIPGVIRPPVLPRPIVNVPGYGATHVQSSIGPPGATSMTMQMNTLPGPPTLNPPTSGVTATTTSNGAAPLVNPSLYQTNTSQSSAGNFNAFSSTPLPGPPTTILGAMTGPTTAALQDGAGYAPTSGPTTTLSNMS